MPAPGAEPRMVSVNVLPSVVSHDHAYVRVGAAETLCQPFERVLSRRVKSTDFEHLPSRELGSPGAFALPLSSSHDAIADVSFASAQVEVGRVYAVPDIAGMQDAESLGDLPEVDLVGRLVGTDRHGIRALAMDFSIARGPTGAGPFPAIASRSIDGFAIDVGPETVFERANFGCHENMIPEVYHYKG